MVPGLLGLLLLMVGTAMLAATALLFVALGAPRGRSAVAVCLFVGAFGAVVLVSEALSLIGELGRGGLLVAHAVLLAGVALAWRRAGAPRPWATWRRPSTRELRAAAAGHPLPAAICAAAALAMAVQLVVGLIGAPTNWDSMTYHLSRAAYWLQEGAALRFEGGSVRQLASPPNAELATAWTMALSGTDRYVELVQWVALLACAAGVAGLARLLDFPRAAAATAAALFVLLPGSLLQSVTTQNDLVVTACIVAAALLGARGVQDRHAGALLFAGAALGLGVGSKGTALFALPAIALVVGAAAWRARPPRRILAWGLGAALAGCVLFGAFTYVDNLADTGDPLGGQQELVDRERYGIAPNAVRVLWNLVDSPGVGLPLADRVFDQTVGRVIVNTGDAVSVMRVGTAINEDLVAGGLVGWLVLCPLVLAVLLWPRSSPARRALALAAVVYALALAVTVDASPFDGRILLPGMALGAPLLALVARRNATLAATGVLALASALPCLLMSDTHPLVPDRAAKPFWSWDRTAQMSVLRPDQDPLIRHVAATFEPDEPLLFTGGEDTWDYPYFGAERDRQVVRVDPADVPTDEGVRCAWLQMRLERDGLAGAVIADAPREVPAPPASMRPAQPSPNNWVVTASDVRRRCEAGATP